MGTHPVKCVVVNESDSVPIQMTQPNIKDIDPIVAENEDRSRGVLLLLNAPGGANIHGKPLKRNIQLSLGLDAFAWTVGEKFLGIRSIPPGGHLLYWNCISETGDNIVEAQSDDDAAGVDQFMNDEVDDNNDFAPQRICDNGKVNADSCTEKDTGMRTSRFVWIDPAEKDRDTGQMIGSILVMRWDDEMETFIDVNDSEASRYEESVRSMAFFSMLVPYPASIAGRLSGMDESYIKACDAWSELSNCIMKITLGRVEPLGNRYISHKTQEYDEKKVMIDNDDVKKDDGDRDLESFQERLQSGLLGPMGEGGCLIFSDIPSPMGQGVDHNGAYITSCYLDQTHVLESIWKSINEKRNHYLKKFRSPPHIQSPAKGCTIDEAELLGEFQIAFITFHFGLNYDAFAHWRRIYTLIVDSPGSMAKYGGFYKMFLRVLYNQLNACPTDFFENELCRNNFIAGGLIKIYESLGEEFSQNPDNILIKYFGYIEELLKRNFNTSVFEMVEATSDDLPMIVDENEELIRF